MFKLAATSLLALLAASTVTGRVVPRKDAPDGYDTSILECYETYHIRYIALDCVDKHDSSFFDQCCHPLLKTESLSDLADQCTPSSSALAAATSAEGSDADSCDSGSSDSSDSSSDSTSGESDGDECTEDDDDCEDGGDDCDDADGSNQSSNVTPSATSTPVTSSTHSSSSSHTSTHTATPAATPAANVEAAPSSSSAKAQATASASSSSSSGSGDSDFVTGGKGTFYFQKGNAGACGEFHSDSDLIVAIDAARYGSTTQVSPLCGKSVQIINVANGKSVTAKIEDACPTCDNDNSIDMSTGTYDQIADRATGLIDIKWRFT